jgi:hypothetical protein
MNLSFWDVRVFDGAVERRFIAYSRSALDAELLVRSAEQLEADKIVRVARFATPFQKGKTRLFRAGSFSGGIL